MKRNTNNTNGTFPKMGLSSALLKGIKSCRYRLPTPIQRKCIPLALQAHDIVAMARTGSGKSAAFLIPVIEKLQCHQTTFGIRCIILAPTRDLAIQLQKFAMKLSKFTDLRICVIIGGESVERQFDGLSRNPDILVATPGRLSYLIKETNLSLSCVEYLIFDEADRLFEMNFAAQLRYILNRLTYSNRQTMLFSATMPKSLIEFTRASLKNPIAIRLDSEHKISQNLQLSYFFLRPDDKIASLLYILTNLISNLANKQILIFVGTKYHVELILEILKLNDIKCLACYGQMDQIERRQNVLKFRKKISNIMIVTDVAARGIDIPFLDYVINFHIPSCPKNFVHRVGRVARNGRFGIAWNLVSPNEMAYVADISRYLGHKIVNESSRSNEMQENNDNNDNVFDIVLDETEEEMKKAIEKEKENGKKDDEIMMQIAPSGLADGIVLVENEYNENENENDIDSNDNNNNNDGINLKQLRAKKMENISNFELKDKVSFGIIPRNRILGYIENVNDIISKNDEISQIHETCKKAMILYTRTRNKATRYGIQKAKSIDFHAFEIHPIFGIKNNKNSNNNSSNSNNSNNEVQVHNMLKNLSKFRPNSTVFEMGGASNPQFSMMQNRRNILSQRVSFQDIKMKKEKKENKKSNKKKKKKNKEKNGNSKQNESRHNMDSILSQYRSDDFYLSQNGNSQGNDDNFGDQFLNVNNDMTGNGGDLKKLILELDPQERQAINTKSLVI